MFGEKTVLKAIYWKTTGQQTFIAAKGSVSIMVVGSLRADPDVAGHTEQITISKIMQKLDAKMIDSVRLDRTIGVNDEPYSNSRQPK